MSDLLVRGGRVVDSTGSRRADVAVRDGIVTEVAASIGRRPGVVVLDASDCVVAPGLVDLHTHLREPGGEQAESIETGCRAAAAGGYTAVVAMPNTEPPVDSAGVVRQVLDIGVRAPVDVSVAGSISVGREGRRLAPMGEMASMGVRIFTDDGSGVQSARLMRHAMEYASALNVTLAEHCEDGELSRGAHMHEGSMSSRLGVPGSPSEAEELMAHRDIVLARLTGARVHLQHVSTAGTAKLLRQARAEGSGVTAEVTPHHLCLTDASLSGCDPVFKVNPPLRSACDVAAMQSALGSGLIDAVATDHAPHAREAKEASFEEAPAGMIGLETALAVVLGELAGKIASLEDLLAAMSWRPAAIAGLSADHGGPIAPGRSANICVIDLAARWTVDPEALCSRSANTPFAGRELRGRVRHTVYRGEPVVIAGRPQR